MLTKDIDTTSSNYDTLIFQASTGDNGTVSPNNIDFTITDQAGNTTSINSLGTITGIPIITDTISPTLSTVSLASNNADPVRAKTNDTVTISFISSENIQNISGTLFTEAGTVTDGGSNNWTLSLMTDGDEVEGNVLFTIDFEDSAGNIGIQVSATTDSTFVDFDRTTPMLSNLTIISDNPFITDTPIYYAKEGDTVTLSFSSSEEIQTAIGTIMGKVPTFSRTGNDWSTSLTVEGTDTEGTVNIDLTVTDLAGNETINITTTMDGTSVFLDRTAPTVPTQVLDILGNASANFKHRSNAEYTFAGQQDLQSDGIVAGSGIYQQEVRFENPFNATSETATLAAGTNSFNPTMPLPDDNPYNFYMNVIDKAGNQSGDTLLYSQKYTLGLYGVVTSSSGSPLRNVIVQVVARFGEECDTGREICSAYTDDEGRYSIILKKDRNYNVIYYDQYHYLAREDIRINQTDVSKNAILEGIESLRQVQTGDKTVRIVTDHEYFLGGQRFHTEILVSSLSGQISVSSNRDQRTFTITSLSRIASVQSLNSGAIITDNGDNTFTISNAGLPVNLDSVQRVDEADLRNNTSEGTRSTHVSGASRMGVVWIPSSGKAARRVSDQKRGEFLINANDFIGEAKDPIEAGELAFAASLGQVRKINKGVPGLVTTYADHKGREIFSGYLPGRLPVDRLKYGVPVRYGSRGLTPERSLQRPVRTSALKNLVKEREVRRIAPVKKNTGCIKYVRSNRAFRFGCSES